MIKGDLRFELVALEVVAFLYEFTLFRLFSLYQGFEAYAFGVLCCIHTPFTPRE
jgi:hypothetical protein